ncbi:MAG: F0F1 ATP synthase subunit B [Lachnospiraceae bacterium]|nr:F0F1 ATP synthase subunit B [Lachnospiraceae bacterium]
MERIFALDLQLVHDVLWTALAVFILFFGLSYLLFNPVREMLEKRKKKISDELSEAEESLKKANLMKAEYDEKLSAVKKESAAILDEAEKKAQKNRSEIINEAKEEAAVIRRRAHEDAEQEKVHARDDMKQEMVTLASQIAGKVVHDKMDTTVQDELVTETLSEIKESTWQDQ